MPKRDIATASCPILAIIDFYQIDPRHAYNYADLILRRLQNPYLANMHYVTPHHEAAVEYISKGHWHAAQHDIEDMLAMIHMPRH